MVHYHDISHPLALGALDCEREQLSYNFVLLFISHSETLLHPPPPPLPPPPSLSSSLSASHALTLSPSLFPFLSPYLLPFLLFLYLPLSLPLSLPCILLFNLHLNTYSLCVVISCLCIHLSIFAPISLFYLSFLLRYSCPVYFPPFPPHPQARLPLPPHSFFVSYYSTLHVTIISLLSS